MKFILTGILAFVMFSNRAQLNMTQVGYLDLNTAHDQGLNDVWGYEDETGIEYVLAGGTKGTSVVSLADPSNPIEVFYEPGMESIWRDLKTWGDYAYVTTEALNGLLIIDLSPLPASTSLTTSYYTGPSGFEWQSAHNLYIDEAGYCYIFGANRGNGGVIILDLNTDPMNPVEVGVFDNWYVHDGYAVNDTLYAAHIGEGFISVVDVNDRSNPNLLGTINTPSFFSHNIWKGAGNYVFTTDEVSGGYIGSYDISDPANIVELDRIQSSPGTGVIPHNAHVLGDFVITSYYADGVVVHDATHPYNLIEVGNFDTYPLQTPTYDGCWGAYPFFSSGLIAATDRTQGLFILNPNYVQACYIEGVITELGSGSTVDNVLIELESTNQLEATNGAGFYASGTASSGLKQVICSKAGYYPDTAYVNLSSGIITVHDVVLTPIPPFNLTIEVFDATTLAPIEDVQIELECDLISHAGITNGLGVEDFSLYYETDYRVRIGKWGYFTYCNLENIDASTGIMTINLKAGYYDDFAFDFGWTNTSDAETGDWTRGEPFGTDGGSQTEFDVDDDCDSYCYVTGNANQANPDVDDVDNGTVTLRSPIMDLSSYADPYMAYSRWFYSFHGAASYDQLRVFVDNGMSGPVLVELVNSDQNDFFQWFDMQFRISDFVTPTSTVQVSFVTFDMFGSANITEAAIDHFYIAEAAELGLDESKVQTKLYPNPAKDILYLENFKGSTKVFDAMGRLIYESEIEDQIHQIDLSTWSNSIYTIWNEGRHHKFIVEK